MEETQVAILSGILLLSAIALFVFLGFLWGQRRTRQSGVYVNRDPDQDHDIELSPSLVRPTAANPTAASPTAANPTAATPTKMAERVPTLTATVVTPSIISDDEDRATRSVSASTQENAQESISAATSPLETMSAMDLKVKSKLYHYIAHVTDVYDGDTITVDIDMGMSIWQRGVRIRLWRVNTSELRGSEREAGLAVRDFVRNLILERDILLRTILDKRGQDRTGKYGRLLGEVLVEDQSGRMLNINKLLLEKGLATPVAADGRRIVSPASAPQPHELENLGSTTASAIVCIYCGELRAVDANAGTVVVCPNCFDDEYAPTSNLDQSVE